MKTLFVVFTILAVAFAAPKAKGGDASDDDCKAREIGGDCDPNDVNCDQCDYCEDKRSFFIRCKENIPENPFEKVTGVWVLSNCTLGDMINHHDKLADGLKGGLCTPWDLLPEEEKEAYKADPKCGLARDICVYGQDESCSPNYWLIKSTLNPVKESNSCKGENNVWDKDTENCKPKSQVAECNISH